MEEIFFMELKQLQVLPRLIKSLYIQIEELTRAIERYTSKGRSDLNYGVRGICHKNISEPSGYFKAVEELREKEVLLMRYTERVDEIKAKIAKIENPEVKEIIRLHFIENKTWQQVANCFSWCDESTPRKVVKKYLKERQERCTC